MTKVRTNMSRIIIVTTTLICASVAVGAKLSSGGQEFVSKDSPNTYVLIVSGVNKDPQEQQAKDRAVIKLRKFFLAKSRVDSERLIVLVDENSLVRKPTRVSTAENLEKTIQALADKMKPADRFILYYVGQANIVAGNLRFNLPGADIAHERLAEWIGAINVSSMLIVLDCPGAGLAVESLTGPGRIIICGARSDQPYSTRFSEYFIGALTDPESDENSDGSICLLEAFTRASRQLDDLYRQQDLLKTETPMLEDDGDGVPSQQPWRYQQDKNDGLAASKFFFIAKEKKVQK